MSVMPRSQWEPWLLYREPIETKTVAENLRKYKTGGLRRISNDQPFGDVIKSAPTRPVERRLAGHPSLKPQSFLRQVVRAILPLGEGVILDPFAGSGSTLAAAEAVGYDSVGVELDPEYVKIAKKAIPALAALQITLRPTPPATPPERTGGPSTTHPPRGPGPTDAAPAGPPVAPADRDPGRRVGRPATGRSRPAIGTNRTVAYHVVCDVCAAVHPREDLTITGVRWESQSDGWLFDRLTGRDICPDCLPQVDQ